jgi:glycosyltransferase involved in cell wall biosynthesis
LYPLFIRRFAACLSVGTRSDQYFRHYGARAIFRSPLFVVNEFLARRAAAMDRQALRASFGIAEDAAVILFAGKLIPKKRPMDLVDAVAKLNDRSLHILFAGDGELRAELEAAVERHGIRATFAGFMNQTQLPEAYSVSDVLVLPSDGRETWGLVVNEAMACGVPVIVSRDCGCAPDLVVDGENGFVVPCGDVTSLAARIAAIHALTRSHDAMRAAARRIVADFNVGAAARGVVDAVEHVAMLER